MDALPSLISDLAVILMLAGVMTLIFKRIGQPVILGYILAGIIAGPSLNFFEITDTENIKTWADIGVIFLLFSIGLDFSFKKLFKMGGTVFITAFTIIFGMMTVGYFTGRLIGWDHMSCLFLGGMMAMSSTTIIIKTYEDLGLMKRQFAGLVIGVLIVEDLFAVVLMVLLSTLAISSNIEGGAIAMDIVRLFAFLLIWFACGIYILPTFFEKMRKWLSDETLVVLSVALCLSMVLLATKTGFSSALGAFVMGSLLGETMQQKRMEQLVKPLKDLFGAVFFVSVGMMIDPSGLLNNWLPILLISVVVILGQSFFGTIGMIFSGQSLKVAMQSGFSLVQVGEFAFIIAQLGENLKVTSSSLYPTIVTVSAISTFFTPFIIKRTDWAYEKFTTKCPPRILNVLSRLSFTPKASSHIVNSETKKLLKSVAMVLVFYLTIIFFIIFFGIKYLHPFLSEIIGRDFTARIVTAIITIGAMAPFMRAVLVKKNRTIRRLMKETDTNKGLLIGVIVLRIFICVGLVGVVLSSLFQLQWILLLGIAVLTLGVIIFNKQIKHRSIAMEKHFIDNLNAKENKENTQQGQERYQRVKKSLLERDLHLSEFTVSPESPNSGKRLMDVKLRQTYGINIVSITRGNRHINIPDGKEQLYPGDVIVVVGTDEQLKHFDEDISQRQNEIPASSDGEMVLEQLVLSEKSSFVGKTIMNSYVRERYRCMIVGMEREGENLVNPSINEALRAGDILWLVGEHDNLDQLAKENQ